MDKYEALRVSAMKQYIEGKIDRITFDVKIRMINEEEAREKKNENKANRRKL